MTVAADTAAWIGAGAGVVAAIAALLALYGVFKWFRPDIRARIDERRQAIRLDIVNDGRATGRIRKVAPVNTKLDEQPARFAGLNGGRFHPAELRGRTAHFLIIDALEQSGPFPAGVSVLVAWGRRRQRSYPLEEVKDISYYGMTSDWPA